MAKLYLSPPKHSQIPTFITEEVPVYRLRGDIFTDDTLFEKGTTLEADEDFVPNEQMFPVNAIAHKIFRAYLKDLDDRALAWNDIPMKERSGYMRWIPRLPAFDKEWEKINSLAKAKRIHICQAVDQSPSILGAPRTSAPKVRAVDMTSIPQMVLDESSTIIQGNKAKAGRPRKNTNVAEVQAAVPA